MFQPTCVLCEAKFDDKDALFEHLISAHPNASTLSFIPSHKGKPKVVFRGYMYYLMSSAGWKHRWHCDVGGCRAVAYTRGQTFNDSASIFLKHTEHNHPGSEARITRERVLQQLYADVAHSDEPPLSIHQRLLASVDNDVAAIMPSLKALSRTICRKRENKTAKKGQGQSKT